MGIFDFLLSKESRLQKAIEAKNINEAIKLINDGANVNTNTEKGQTALWLAVERGSLKLMELLLAKSVNLDTTYDEGNSALMMSLLNKNKEIANLLLDNKAIVNKANNKSITPLIQVLKTGDFVTAEILINKGAGINAKYKSASLIWLPLTKKKSIKIVKLLLENKIKLNQENNKGFTELMYAIDNGENELAQLFIDNGADVNYYSKKSKSTPLSVAINKGELTVVQKLVDNKVDINFANKSIEAPVGIAITNDRIDILKLLLENGATLKTTKKSNSYLVNSILKRNANFDIVKTLVSYGADINEEDFNELTGFSQVPLMFAIDRENVHVVEFFIENGANLHFGSNGITPLTYAVKCGNKKILSLFEKQNLKPKATDYYNAARLLTEERVDKGDLTFRYYSEDMLQLLTKAIEINPKYADAYGYRGVYYCADIGYRQNRSLIAKSLSDLNKAIKLGGTNPLFFFSRGTANDESGNVDAAIADYTVYLKSYPKGSNAYNNRGLLYQNKGNYQAAENDFTEKIEIDEHNTAGYINRASLYISLGREDDAIRDWEAGLEIDPGHPSLLKNTGLYYYNQIAGNPDLANIALIDKALRYLRKSSNMGDEQSREWYNTISNRFGYEPS